MAKPQFGNVECKLGTLAKDPPPEQLKMDAIVGYVGGSRISDSFNKEYLVQDESRWKSHIFTNRI